MQRRQEVENYYIRMRPDEAYQCLKDLNHDTADSSMLTEFQAVTLPASFNVSCQDPIIIRAKRRFPLGVVNTSFVGLSMYCIYKQLVFLFSQLGKTRHAPARCTYTL